MYSKEISFLLFINCSLFVNKPLERPCKLSTVSMVSMIEKKLSIDSDKKTKISCQFSISIVSDRKSIVNCQLVIYLYRGITS